MKTDAVNIESIEVCCEMLKSIVDCMYEAVCVIDSSGKVIIWNKSAENLYGISWEEIRNKKINNFFPNAIVDKVRETHLPIENKNHFPKLNSHILANSRPIYINEKFYGAISTDRDFDDVIKLYSELERVNSKVLFLENEVKRFAGDFGEIIGEAKNIREKIDMARQIAPTDTSVMITGESGTGKEVFARGIHELSGRKGIFVPVNCSAIPAELFESEFFGYCHGAFTGSSKNGKAGIFELGNEGTIFLDEIGDMPLHMQAKLLRVLQEREIMRLGGEEKIELDIRVISATNKNLKKMVETEEFREDLYYRINVVEIQLPPLRERKQDIPLFVQSFLKKFAVKSKKDIKIMEQNAMNLLINYDWPGNIRELMNVIEHAVVVSNGKIIGINELPKYISAKEKMICSCDKMELDLGKAVRKIEIENIKKALRITKNNKSQASKLLNMPRGTLYHKIEEYKIEI